MDVLLLILLITVVCVLLVTSALRLAERRRASRLQAALTELEAVSAPVIADWPPEHTTALLDRLVAERLRRSAAYKQGWHTASSRERDLLALRRIRDAERRLQAALRTAPEEPGDTRDRL